jgi:ATP-dependent Clp protease protease subunit
MAKFKVTMSKDKTATLFIYEGIYWGLAQEFADELQRLKNDGAEKFIVRINSPGGSAYDGLAICNLLKSYDAMVVVDSMAASAASLIAMGAKTIKMQETSQMLVHGVRAMIYGNIKDLEKAKVNIEQLEKNIMKEYLARIKIDENELLELMDEDRFMNSDEALEKGFADEVLPVKTGFQNFIETVVNLFKPAPEVPKTDEGGQMKQLLLSLVTIFALATDATEEMIKEAAKALVAERDELKAENQRLNTELDEAENTNAELRGKVEQYQSDAQAQIEAQTAADAEAFADQMIESKSALPADREQMIEDHKKDPAMAKRLYARGKAPGMDTPIGGHGVAARKGSRLNNAIEVIEAAQA